MALTTYAGLKAGIAGWLHRSDLTSVIPDFITLAEADIARDVRCTAMETVASGTLTGETLDFPSRYLDARRLSIDGDLYRYETPGFYSILSDNSVTDWVYTIQGQKFYILNGASGDSYSLTYQAMFASLVDDADTNWLLTNHPSVYLFAGLKHACTYTSNDKGLMKYAGAYLASIKALNVAEQRAAYSGHTLAVRVNTAYMNP